MGIVVLGFLKDHWRVFAALGLAALLLFGGYAFGRYATPPNVVIHETVKTVEVEKQVVVEKEKIVYQKVHDTDQKKNVHVEVVEIKHPDGTVETHKTADDKTGTVSHEAAVQYVDRIVEKEVVKYVDREIEKKVEVSSPKPDWRVAPLIGVNGPSALGILGGKPFNALQDLSLGVEVERRIIGPVSVGAWAVSSGQGGLSVAVEF
ncbi:hypothetical protein UFOVP75_129 [uncultured Caudovirales phage]|uniref:Uncharacterized protein n=1 Tax=uncultured Caudovirales phage TaxID=2100421 RepID=A0A6J5L282_9CAUD|nr:hypothetical protein UFOVP75_129 [uncultured Caudovirales phage]